MHRNLSTCLCVLALALAPMASHAEEVIERLTLAGGAKKDYTIEAASRTKVGFNLPNDIQSNQCENECIQISQEGGIQVASSMGTAVGLLPQNGKITFTITNVEDFPIEVEVFRR